MNGCAPANIAGHRDSRGYLGNVKILAGPERVNIAGRVQISPGTEQAAQNLHESVYESGARVPTPGWRLLDDEELASLDTREGSWDQSSTIALVRPDGEIRRRILRLQHHYDEPAALAEYQVQEHVRILADIVHELCEFPNPIIYHGITSNDPNCATLTLNPLNGLRTGIHFDDWDGPVTSERTRSKNRISLNLGPCARYSMFIAFTLEELGHCLREAGVKEVEGARTSNAIGRAFMTRFPDTPVIRVKVLPGEGYIAPTENVLHDGSNEGILCRNRHVTFRGNFRLRPDPILVR